MVSIMSRFLNNLLFQHTVLKKQICFFQVMGDQRSVFLSIKEVNEEGRKIKLIS